MCHFAQKVRSFKLNYTHCESALIILNFKAGHQMEDIRILFVLICQQQNIGTAVVLYVLTRPLDFSSPNAKYNCIEVFTSVQNEIAVRGTLQISSSIH